MAPRSAAFLLHLLSLFASLSTADFTFVDPTTNCQTTAVNGRAIYCCDGKCYDGSSIQDSTGQCSGFNDACYDPPSIPRCATDQVYTNIKDDTVDAGLGNCYIGNECQWVRDIYTYSCCDCPVGFIAYHSYCNGPGGRYVSFCIGCDGDGEDLSYDENTGAYSCAVGAGTIVPVSTSTSSAATPVGTNYCSLITQVSNANSVLGDLVTLTGLACDFTPNFITFSSLAVSFAATVLNHGDGGVTSNIFGLVLALGVAALAIAGAPEFIAGLTFGSSIVAEVGEFCGVNTVLGVELTAAGALAADYKDKNHCPTNKLRRFVETGGEKGLDTRVTTTNPCAELVALFPTDFNIASNAQTACNEILAVDPSTIIDDDVTKAVTDLQQACNAVPSFTFLVQLEAFLKAVSNVVPYCDGFNTEATLYASRVYGSHSTSSTTSYSPTSHFMTSHSTKTTTSKSLHTISKTKSTHTPKSKSSHTTKPKSKDTTKAKDKSTPHATKTKPKPVHHMTHHESTHTPKTNLKYHKLPHHTKEKERTSCA